MKIHKVIGLMSGTSLDGLDLAYCHIGKKLNRWEYELVNVKSLDYAVDMREKLKNAIHLSAVELLTFHNDYGTWLGKQILDFITGNNLEVNFISSHGHTVHHRPNLGLTFQLGSGQHLANACGIPTICDFRSNDVALGGEGAPLVPIGDRLFFGQYDYCLNLGGISNISFEKDSKRIAYDIGPANMLLNHIIRDLPIPYDDEGKLARSGNTNNALLERLNSLPYYSQPYPKSTGYEWFCSDVIPILEKFPDSTENLLRTAVEHISIQIANNLSSKTEIGKMTLLITGGGAKNKFLIETLGNFLGEGINLEVPSKELVEFKEALVFALMGVLRMEREINVLSSVTGAQTDSSSGVIYIPA